jgi:transcriptional regulator with XRE-family HTH domain
MGFRERLRQQREARGMTQAALAKKLGVTTSAVGNYELGISMPREDVLLKLFTVLDAEPNFLFQDSFEKDTVLTPGERQMVERYRALDVKRRQAMDSILEALSILSADSQQKEEAEEDEEPERRRRQKRLPLSTPGI